MGRGWNSLLIWIFSVYIFDLGEGQLQGSDPGDCDGGICKTSNRTAEIICVGIPNLTPVYHEDPRIRFLHHPEIVSEICQDNTYAAKPSRPRLVSFR